MFGIGIIDDSKDYRDSFVEDFEDLDSANFKLDKEDWQVAVTAPLPDINEYPDWILENDLTAVILDEKLQNGGVTYGGHEVLELIKGKFPLPVFVVTEYKDDPDLETQFEKATDIIGKPEWARERTRFAGRVLSSAKDYSDVYVSKHIEMDALADKAAKDEANEDEIKKLEALRDQIQLPLMKEDATREEVLNEFESSVNLLEDLIIKAKERLGEQD
ncbi:MAG: hypothetical protein KF756_08205 [Acidobacteria bacterium]|nr:hypothetical protein [Acidobacteriota bacterium]